MQVVLLQILLWILRIILFLLLLILVVAAIILIVPIRYQAEGSFLEKKPDVRGKITWFFYLVYTKLCYEEEFQIQVRVFGFKVFDSTDGEKKPKKTNTKTKNEETAENTVGEINVSKENIDELTKLEKEVEAEAKEEAELTKQVLKGKKDNLQKESENTSVKKEKKSFPEKIEDIKSKIQDMIQKIKDIIAKIRDGKLKIEHYLELWNRDETQITFSRAKTKFGRMIKAILPRKWKLTGEVGFDNPVTTGQLMGVLGAMYPILGNKVQIIPNFEEQVINVEGKLKGHIRLGNLLFQLVSLLLNRHCFKFIKIFFNELGSSKKEK